MDVPPSATYEGKHPYLSGALKSGCRTMSFGICNNVSVLDWLGKAIISAAVALGSLMRICMVAFNDTMVAFKVSHVPAFCAMRLHSSGWLLRGRNLQK